VNRQTESQTATSTWSDAEPAIESPLQPRGPGGPAGLRTDWPLWRIVLGLAIWPLLEQFMMAAVWFVDSALAGHLPPDIVKPASDAVGAAVYMMWLMGLMQGAVGVGATALVARTIGGGRFDEAETAVGQAMLLALVWGGFNAVLFFAISRPVGVFLNLQPEAMAFCTEYLRILAVVAPLRAVLFIGAAALRGAGDTRSPFYVMLLVNLINIAVSIALVAEFSPIGGMGVRGIALGTAAAWTVGGAAMWALLVRGRGGVQLHLRELRPRRQMIYRLCRIGIPALLENGGHWGANFIVIWIVGQLAARGLEQHALGAHNFGIRIEGFSFLPGFAFSVAAATLAGQYLGVRDEKTAQRAVWWALGYGAGLMTMFGVLFITVPEALVRVITDDPHFREVVPRLLFIVGWAQIGFAAALVLSGALRGAGDTKWAMIITSVSTFGVRLPLVWVLGVTLGWGLDGVWIALAIELGLRGLLFLARFLYGGWTKIQV